MGSMHELIEAARKLRNESQTSAPNVVGETFYRFEGHRPYDDGSEAEIVMRKFTVERVTRCGVWLKLNEYGDKPVFVLSASRMSGKRFAYRSRAAAWHSYLCRTAHRLSRARANLDFCERLDALNKIVTLDQFDVATAAPAGQISTRDVSVRSN